jgi:AcrR family transcriptional regulator
MAGPTVPHAAEASGSPDGPSGGPADNPSGGATDGRRLRWNQHRAERRASFVAAGARAIDQLGPAASAEQIADAAGVSRTVLYRYFRDREDLRKEIADQVVQQVVASVLPTLAIDRGDRVGNAGTPRQIITAAVDVIIGWLDQHPNLYRFLRSRRDDALSSVENTLAGSVAALLQGLMMAFGMDGAEAEPGAYGIVGFVEATGSWWVEHRTMSRERATRLVSDGVWHLLEGTARAHGIALDYDAPLPSGALATGGAQPGLEQRR